jgi:hypothetical protein
MLAQTADGLNAIFRQEVDDILLGTPPSDADRLWKDVEVYNYMTEACDAVARDTLGLFKTMQITLVPNQQVYKLQPGVLDIRSARTLTFGNMLTEHNVDDYAGVKIWDYGQPLIGSTGVFSAVGVPVQYMRDYDNRAIRLIPIPAAADTLELQCVVTPMLQMAAGMPVPFTDTVDQRLLLLKMKALGYAKHDADTFDAQRSQAFAQEYEARARERQVERRRVRRAPGAVRMEW